jgi:UDP-N-acetyl-D-glucosamine/UDP-N-acetyl-D-galactosamine dehydrogenase
MLNLSNIKIGIIGLGYVGLPLAVEFSKKYDVKGIDLDQNRISELRDFLDRNNEINVEDFQTAKNLDFVSTFDEMQDRNVFIITVPTPIDEHNKPNLTALKNASISVGNIMARGAIVVYESTVYPGVTERICSPLLQEASGLIYNEEFFCGYSPERINPGDDTHTLINIKKIVSGSTHEAAVIIDELYSSIITAGTYRTDSIQIAEAAKVIENTQRDLNVALVNEFSKIFNILGLDTTKILDAADTKWNFMKFVPGLVGGHCIGVDPYYLTYLSSKVGYEPEVILAGRKLNNGMSSYVADKITNSLSQYQSIEDSKVLVLGITFKENCSDVRNSQIFNTINILEDRGIICESFDPIANAEQVKALYNRSLIKELKDNYYDVILLAVPHNEICKIGLEKILSCGTKNSLFFDLKAYFNENESDFRL